MTVLLLSAAAVFGWLHIRADYRQDWQRTYIFKPLTMLAIIAVVLIDGAGGDLYRNAILTGLLLSLVGDVFLMLKPARFLGGLAAFLLAHIVYAIAFSSRMETIDATAMAATAASGTVMFLLIRRGAGRLAIPVAVYTAAIAAMVATSLSAAIDVPDPGRLAAATGALLFLFSDAMIGYARFRRRFHLAQALILGTYYPAQGLIALSAGMLYR